jgi:hypothetical protein
MKVQRLFHVLVVMSATGCDSDEDGTDRRRTGSGDPAVDAAVGASSDAAGDAAGSAEGDPCFCDTQMCCDRSIEPAQVADGFVCCWSTTCP